MMLRLDTGIPCTALSDACSLRRVPQRLFSHVAINDSCTAVGNCAHCPTPETAGTFVGSAEILIVVWLFTRSIDAVGS